MVEHSMRTSSGVAKAALATGITGAVLGLNNNSANGGGILGNLFGNNNNNVPYGRPYGAPFAAPYGGAVEINYGGYPYPPAYGGGCCNGLVQEKELNLVREIAGKDAVIGQLSAEKYTDLHVQRSLAPVYGQLNQQNQEICDLKAALAMEVERRNAGDERLYTFVDGNYIRAHKVINSRDVDYHRCVPVLKMQECCCGSAPTTTDTP